MNESVTVVCCCSLPDGHLGQSRVRDDHREPERAAAVHLPHLLRHARRHVRLLWIPDQVSQSFLLLALFFLLLKAPVFTPGWIEFQKFLHCCRK